MCKFANPDFIGTSYANMLMKGCCKSNCGSLCYLLYKWANYVQVVIIVKCEITIFVWEARAQ
jgi:hypothetical protein